MRVWGGVKVAVTSRKVSFSETQVSTRLLNEVHGKEK